MGLPRLLEEINSAIVSKDKRADIAQPPSTYVMGMKKVRDMVSDYHHRSIVVIPMFIADWLEKCKGGKHPLSYAIGKFTPCDVSDWLSLGDCHNEKVFARAWIEGYEVEKEPRYWVRDKKDRGMLGRKDDGSIYGASYVTVTSQLDYPKTYTFTEKEIKEYDERYWAFAVPVGGSS